jgi:hypothetical protein
MDIKQRVADLIEAHALVLSALPEILEGLKDISVPLDERWELYSLIVNKGVLLKNNPYGDGELHILGNNLTQYDDFNNDRYVTVKYTDMYQEIVEADEAYQECLAAAKENLPAWQEHILASGYASFTYDW